MADDTRDRIIQLPSKRVANPLARLMPFQTLLETTGRKSGEPRRTPLGGSRVGDQFWFVSEFGEKSQYVKNIKANPNVRLGWSLAQGRRRTWYPTTTPRRLEVVATDEQLRSAHVIGHQNLLTIRVDLTD